MLELLKRMTLGRAVQLALAATIVTMLLAGGSILQGIEPARTLRWAALLALAALAVAYAARSRERAWSLTPALVAGALVAVAAVSTLWSANPRLTLGRTAALALVLVVAAALARAESPELVLEGVLLGAVAVAVGGLLLLVFDHDRAVQTATTVSPARYQGLGGGPNMAAMVFAIAAPLALHFIFESRTRTMRLAWGAALALLLGSIAFSGSRGALAAAFAGLAVYALLGGRPVVLGTAALLAGATLAVSVLPSPASSNPPQPTGQDPAPAQVTPAPGYFDANLQGPRLQDDIGHPGIGVAETTRRERTLSGSSGRTEAWRGALGLVADRPVVGYGFGTEDRTFVDRYVFFNSNVPENSYVGILLQLGIVGLVVLLALAVALVLPSLRRGSSRVAVAATAALAAALVLAFFQSYLYAAGNAATIAAWVCAFAATGAAAARS
ncbi:MAG: O-antigen ligase family protein [Actinomycetota bacterium]